MSAGYVIVDAKLSHIRAIVARLRPDDLAEIAATGMKPRHLLTGLWRESHIRRAALVDGEIAAVWGCAGTMLSPVGEAWLLTAPAVAKLPLAFLKETREEMRAMLATKRIVTSGVLASYESSIRFMRMVGFTVGAPTPLSSSGAMFRALKMERAHGI
jgi:hypothetical protein